MNTLRKISLYVFSYKRYYVWKSGSSFSMTRTSHTPPYGVLLTHARITVNHNKFY